MTVSSLATAVAVGTLLGLIGRWTLPTGRRIPFWVPLALAVGAAVLGTVIGRLAGIDASGVSPMEVILQVVFAGAAVTLVVTTAEPRPSEGRHDVGGAR
ncbi:hypothetical protein ACIBSW_12455 [Actinoplanes sp. NPDC049668]|uniref:hypothetical protein n=1 Tax=unclassified Actinoplanes TaxID=2626549 RepID=UPI0033B42866